jgi:hypothetical protein
MKLDVGHNQMQPLRLPLLLISGSRLRVSLGWAGGCGRWFLTFLSFMCELPRRGAHLREPNRGRLVGTQGGWMTLHLVVGAKEEPIW